MTAVRGHASHDVQPREAVCARHPGLRAWWTAAREPTEHEPSEMHAWRVARHGRLPGAVPYYVHSF